MFIEAGGDTRRIDVLPIEGCTLFADDVDVTKCECTNEADMAAAVEVIAACGSPAQFNRRLRGILLTISEQMQQSGETNANNETAIRVRSRRLSGTILLTEELGHLSRQFEKTKPSCWWYVITLECLFSLPLVTAQPSLVVHRTTVFLLVVRLLSTSMVALLREQGTQVGHTQTFCVPFFIRLSIVTMHLRHTLRRRQSRASSCWRVLGL